MKARTPLNRASLEDRFLIDSESGLIRYRIVVKSNKAGSLAGTIRSDGYVRIRIDGYAHYAHRIIYFYATGEQPEYIDHINGNKSDNRLSNLRAATNSQNMANQSKSPQGVYLRFGKWNGRVMKDYKTYRISPTSNKAEAERSLRDLRESLHGAFVPC